jgi:TRAP-type C4-dicarboxylate transport system permease large subunit
MVFLRQNIEGTLQLDSIQLIMATVVAFFYKAVYTNMGNVFKKAMKNVWPCVSVQLAAAFMIGAFYAAGQISAVQDFAKELNSNLIKLGGAAALCLVGMLTGSQTTAQNAVFAILAPVLVSLGVDKVYVAVSGAHLAMSGQGMPPVCLTTFVVCGLVGAITEKKADPVKTMILNLPMCLMFLAIGILFMYI